MAAETVYALTQLLLLVALLIPAFLFLLTQHRTLRAIQPDNRRMMPGLVWLQLIPVFGQIWQFVVVTRIAESIRKELESRDEDSLLGISANTVEHLGQRPTLTIGIAYCSLNLAFLLQSAWKGFQTYPASETGLMALITLVLSLSSITCWIIYWVRLGAIKRRLRRTAGGSPTPSPIRG